MRLGILSTCMFVGMDIPFVPGTYRGQKRASAGAADNCKAPYLCQELSWILCKSNVLWSNLMNPRNESFK